MWKIFKGVINLLFWVIISVALTISLNSHIQRAQGIQQPMLFGYGFAVVETGSMEPNVPAGSLIILKNTDSYEVGDIITYTNANDVSITHRVVSIENDMVTAKGDANKLTDPVFSKSAISGEVIYTNLKAGAIVKKIQSPVFVWILIGIVVLSFVWDIVSSIIKKRKKSMAKECDPLDVKVDSVVQKP